MAKNNKNAQAAEAPKTSSTKLKFAASTFGQKKSAPVTPERLEELRKIHAEMCDTAQDGTEIFPSKTAFVVEAHKRNYTTKEIAEVLEMKPAVVYSMIWRVTSNYKPKRASKTAEAAETVEGAEVETVDDSIEDSASDVTDEELEEAQL